MVSLISKFWKIQSIKLKGEYTKEEQLSEELNFRKESKNFDSKAKKFLTILTTSILLLIPIGFMSGMIHDRSSYRNEAVENVAKSWADSQVIGTPKMSFITHSLKMTKKQLKLKLMLYWQHISEIIVQIFNYQYFSMKI